MADPPSVPQASGDWKSDLATTLDAIRGTVIAHQVHQTPANPGLKVNDGVIIPLPLDLSHVDLLKDAASLSAHNTWVLDPSQFQVANPAWPTFFNKIVSDISQQMGMGLYDSDFRVELDKLLLYETGSFLPPRKDSDGRTATLSICLPSAHQGGEIHISQAGQHQIFDTSQSIFDLTAVAWFSSATYETKPVTRGHQLVLMYSIIPTEASDPATTDAFLVEQDACLKRTLFDWNTEKYKASRLVYFLDHQYSKPDLKMSNLKGRDKALFEALQIAGADQRVHIFLGNVTRTIKGDIKDHVRIDFLCNANGTELASDLQVPRSTVLNIPHYDERSPDSEEGGIAMYDSDDDCPIVRKYHDSAVVLIPHDEIHRLLRHHCTYKLHDIVLAQIKTSFQGTNGSDTIRIFAYETLEATSQFKPAIAQLAWQIRDRTLFNVAISDQLSAGFTKNSGETLYTEELTDELEEALSPYPASELRDFLDWGMLSHPFDEWSYRPVWYYAPRSVEESLNSLRSCLPDDFVSSFDKWRPATALLSLIPPFKVDDDKRERAFDRVMTLISQEWENKDWVQKILIPLLRSAAADTFHSSLACKVVVGLLAKGRQGYLPEAETVADQILGSRGVVKSLSWSGKYQCDQFLDLLRHLADSGLHDKIGKLLFSSLEGLEEGKEDKALKLTRSMSKHLIPKLLTIAKTGNTDQAVRGFIIYLLRAYAQFLPTRPVKPEGWAHRLRCKRRCEHCEPLNLFLASPEDQIRRFTRLQWDTMEHFEKVLDIYTPPKSRKPFRISGPGPKPVSPERPFGYEYWDAVVTKLGLEHKVELEKYEKECEEMREKLAGLRGDAMEKFLGSALYEELVLLKPRTTAEDLREPEGPKKRASERLRARDARAKRVKIE